MSTHSSSDMAAQAATAQRRRTIRYIAAALAAVTAAIYVMIGIHLVSVVEGNADQAWALAPAAAYALGAVLLVVYDRRLLWILGAALQVFVIFTYFNVAPQRTPAYEVWGIVLRAIQLLILIVLVYLEIRLPQKQSDSGSPGAREPLQSHS